MGFGGALLAVSAVKGITSIGAGYAQNAEDKYNDQIDANKLSYVQTMGDIEQGQMVRQAGQVASKSYANAAALGVEPTGSVAAVMLSAQTQMNTDQAIAAFNTSQKEQALTSGPSGVSPIFSGYASALSDLLIGGTNYTGYNTGTLKKSINTK